MSFSGLLMLGMLPDSVLSVVLVPLIDQFGQIFRIESERPFNWLLHFLLEQLLIDKFQEYAITTSMVLKIRLYLCI